MGAIKRLLLLSLVFAPCIGWRAAVPGAGGAHRLRARPPALCDADPLDQADPLDEEAMVTRELNKELTAKFNEELYRHLKQRPEYENSDMYRQLDQRLDVDEKFRYGTPSDADAALLTNCQLPKPSQATRPPAATARTRPPRRATPPTPARVPTAQTPGEVIDIVLRALSSKDWERPEQGIELLRNYSSQASALAPTEEITPLVRATARARLAPSAYRRRPF